MCMIGYFGLGYGTIMFISPKISLSLKNTIDECADDIVSVLNDLGFICKIQIIADNDRPHLLKWFELHKN